MLNEVTGYLSKALITNVTHIDSDISLALGAYKLWITCSWRLEKDNGILVGNDNLVELRLHEDYKDDYDDTVQSIKDRLIGTVITKVYYSQWNELTLNFSSGHVLRTFLTNGQEEDDADCFQFYLTKQRYIVMPQGVELEDLGPFYKS